ncbi:MAG: hypothetical protein GXO69_04295 [Acidobacteria bacterium]|nr:hypothetical protein [Acidobacteriota bacterium]
MKKVLILFVIVLLSVVAFSHTTPAKYQKLWKKVEKLEQKGKLKRSEKRVDKIYNRALKDKNAPQIVRAILYKTRYISYREKYIYEDTIPFLEKQVKIQPFPVKNILHSYLGGIYQMLSQNVISNVSIKFKPGNSKFPSLYFLSEKDSHKKILSHFKASLLQADRLRHISLDGYGELISGEANTDLLPLRNLYDLLAIRTLRYINSTSFNEKGVDPYKLTDEMLLPVNQFLKSKLPIIQSIPELKTSADYFRKLLRESLRTNDYEMFFFIDIMRITSYFDRAKEFEGEWGSWEQYYSYAEAKETDALKSLLNNTNIGNQYPAVALLLADRYNCYGNEYSPSHDEKYRFYKKKAVELCRNAIKKFPHSPYAPLNKALIGLIQSPGLTVTLDRYFPPHSPAKAIVTFQNITDLYVKIIQTDKFPKCSIYSDLTENEKKIVNTTPPVKQWEVKLPNTDFQEHTTEITIPGLPVGCYFLLMSNTPDFNEKHGGILLKKIKITPVGVMFEKTDKQHLQCRIVDRTSGKGIPNVRVVLSNYIPHWREKKEKSDNITIEKRSNQDGRAIFSYPYNSAKIEVFYKGAKYEFHKESFIPKNKKKFVQTNILLDRAIYRPGQTVYFKGITYETDAKGSRALANKDVTYSCFSSDGKEIGKISLKTNDFGSATGSFKIPPDTMTGQASISNNLHGRKRFSIEEYKRPKYEIVFDDPPHPLNPNAEVTVSGTVRMLSGEAVSDAEVSYSIDLNAYFKCAEFWDDWGDSIGTIKKGKTVTDSKGKFKLSFQLKKPAQLPDDYLRGYVVNVKATTEDGETLEGDEEVRVADISKVISTDFPENINILKHRPFTVSIHDLYGNPESQAISVSIHKLKMPGQVVMKRQFTIKPDVRPIEEKIDHKGLSEKEISWDKYNPSTWKIEKTVYRQRFTCNGKTRLPHLNTGSWAPGEYRVDIELNDPTGKKQKKSKYLKVFNPKSTICPVASVLWANFPPYVPKEKKLTVYVASAAQNTDVLLQLVGPDRVLKEQHIDLSNELKKVSIPLPENTESPVVVRISTVKFNRYFEKHREISLKPVAKTLSLKISSRKKVLAPGESGSSIIQLKTGKKPEPDGELTVTLYDASLDFFDYHSFSFFPAVYDPFFPEVFIQDSLQKDHWDFEMKSYWDAPVNNRGRDEDELARSPFYSLKDPLKWYGVYHTYYLDIKKVKVDQSTGETILVYVPSELNSPGIEGVVTDESGTPLPDVTVTLKNISNQTMLRIATNQNGKFGFGTLPPGKYTCVFYLPGFQPLSRSNLVVTSGIITKLKVKLAAAKIQESIIVTAEAPPVENENDTETGTIPEPDEKPKPRCNIMFRKNFKETALFVPILKPDKNGTAKIRYKMPDSITRWHMQAFAHTRDMQTASAETSLVTKKNIMVIPNFPRFFRSGDTIVVKANVFNTSGKAFNGQINLKLFAPDSKKTVNLHFGLAHANRHCTTDAYGHSTFQWKLQIPRGLKSIRYQISVKGDLGNDGQEGVIPVLPSKVQIQDSIPFTMSYNRKKTISVEKILNAPQNKSIELKKMTIEIDNDPTRIVINSLPYLMKFPHECSEQLFSRYFANTVAENLLKTSPELIKLISAYENNGEKDTNSSKMPENWKKTMSRNRENLKTLLSLYQKNSLLEKNKKVLEQLEERQSKEGGWPWFPGMEQSVYITQYIISGFGMLKKTGMIDPQETAVQKMIRNAVLFTDKETVNEFSKSLKNKKALHLTESIIQYLYARSFFYKDIKPGPGTGAVIDAYLNLGEKEWINQLPMMKGMLAISLYRFGKKSAARGILRFLKNTAVMSNEKGMYWTAFNRGFYWYGSEIDNACIMLEAFQEIGKDRKAVELLKLFILRHKKTSAWSNTRSTTLACYALLNSGRKKNPAPPEVKVKTGSHIFRIKGIPDPLQSDSISFTDKEIVPALGKITIEKSGNRPILGAVYLDTLENLNKIKASDRGLSVSKTLMIVPAHAPRSKAVPLTASTKLHPGDKIMVYLYINAENDFTYVHLKDMRPSGFEPVSVHSSHKWENGLSYFESIRDDSVDIFFSQIPKGEHLITYQLIAVNPGKFNTGIARIQCMYAPEYKGYSGTGTVRVSGIQSNTAPTPSSSVEAVQMQ